MRVRTILNVRRTMTAQPMLRDEYERPRVEVRQSTLNSQIAGEGLFALRDFKTEDIMAFYNGVKGMYWHYRGYLICS